MKSFVKASQLLAWLAGITLVACSSTVPARSPSGVLGSAQFKVYFTLTNETSTQVTLITQSSYAELPFWIDYSKKCMDAATEWAPSIFFNLPGPQVALLAVEPDPGTCGTKDGPQRAQLTFKGLNFDHGPVYVHGKVARSTSGNLELCAKLTTDANDRCVDLK